MTNISSLSDLQDMATNLDGDYVLTADIDASATSGWNLEYDTYTGFIPIGNSSTPFTGTFDGGGYTISNLYINRYSATQSSYGQYQGLFGYIKPYGDILDNGDFTGNADHWTLEAPWEYYSNTVRKNSNGICTLIQPTAQMTKQMTVGRKYILRFTSSGWSGDTIAVTCGGATLSVIGSNKSSYYEEFTCTDDTLPLTFTASNASRVVLDNIFLYEVVTIKNVTLKNWDITGGGYVGILSGYINSSVYSSSYDVYGVDISSITINGGKVTSGTYVTGKGTNPLAGSLAGYAIGSKAEDCYINADVSAMEKVGVAFGSISSCSCDSVTCTGSAVGPYGDYTDSAPLFYGGGFSGALATSVINLCSSSCGVSCMTRLRKTTQTGADPTIYVGGFVGLSTSSTYTQCSSTGNIFNTRDHSNPSVLNHNYIYMGGFFGKSSCTVSECYSTGDVSCVAQSLNGTFYVTINIAGFSGYGGTHTNCYSRGDILTGNIECNLGYYYAAGFVGTGSSCTYCYSTGKVPNSNSGSIAANTKIGGFAGTIVSGYTSCHFDIDTSGTTNAVGSGISTGITGHATEDMKLIDTYTSWDFDAATGEWIIQIYEEPAIAATNLIVWLSESDDYDSFTSGTNDSNSITVVLPSTNEIRWISAIESLCVGTSGDEWQISSNKLDTALTPTNYKVSEQSEHGSSLIQPIKINSSLVFVDYVGRKLREMVYNDYKYNSINLAALSEHITKGRIVSIARQKNPESIIWAVLGDGNLISVCFDKEQNVTAWSRHPLGGDGEAISVCVIPDAEEDIVYIEVRRTIDSTESIYLEKIAPWSFDTIEDAYFVDCGITFEPGSATSTITGLDHLEGETVQILGDGVVMDEQVVVGGSVTAEIDGVATAVSKAQAGLSYEYTLKPMRLQMGSQEGTTLGSTLRVSELVISFLLSSGVQYATDTSDEEDVDFDDPRWINSSTITGLFTGDVVVAMQGGFSVQAPIIIKGSDPLPCTVRAMVHRVEKTGR